MIITASDVHYKLMAPCTASSNNISVIQAGFGPGGTLHSPCSLQGSLISQYVCAPHNQKRRFRQSKSHPGNAKVAWGYEERSEQEAHQIRHAAPDLLHGLNPDCCNGQPRIFRAQHMHTSACTPSSERSPLTWSKLRLSILTPTNGMCCCSHKAIVSK